VVDDTGYAKGRIPKNGKCHVTSNWANMTLSGAAADKRLHVYYRQKQALVHIYNIVTGSVAVSLDASIKSEVTKSGATIKSCWFRRCFGFGYSR
jgi:hypothetical protein